MSGETISGCMSGDEYEALYERVKKESPAINSLISFNLAVTFDLIARLYENIRVSLEDVCERSGIGPSILAKLEELPDASEVIKLAQMANLHVDGEPVPD